MPSTRGKCRSPGPSHVPGVSPRRCPFPAVEQFYCLLTCGTRPPRHRTEDSFPIHTTSTRHPPLSPATPPFSTDPSTTRARFIHKLDAAGQAAPVSTRSRNRVWPRRTASAVISCARVLVPASGLARPAARIRPRYSSLTLSSHASSGSCLTHSSMMSRGMHAPPSDHGDRVNRRAGRSRAGDGGNSRRATLALGCTSPLPDGRGHVGQNARRARTETVPRPVRGAQHKARASRAWRGARTSRTSRIWRAWRRVRGPRGARAPQRTPAGPQARPKRGVARLAGPARGSAGETCAFTW